MHRLQHAVILLFVGAEAPFDKELHRRLPSLGIRFQAESAMSRRISSFEKKSADKYKRRKRNFRRDRDLDRHAEENISRMGNAALARFEKKKVKDKSGNTQLTSMLRLSQCTEIVGTGHL